MRVGVFICHCGTNIAETIHIPTVKQAVQTIPHVCYVEDTVYLCATEGLKFLQDAIVEQRLERVVVASCTPRTHEDLFKSTCHEAGLNPHLCELVNIREQCAWVHKHEPERTTEKAIELIRMGIEKAILLRPLQDLEIEVEPAVLIIGAGIAGITAALNISEQGIKVYLIEIEAGVGGILKKIHTLFPSNRDATELLTHYTNELINSDNITVFTSSTVKRVDGVIGNYHVVLEQGNDEHDLAVGTIIVATGAQELKPIGLYGYGASERIVTQLEFEHLFHENLFETVKNVVMIQCAGAKGIDSVNYCSRTCCIIALKNAILIKKTDLEINVYVLYIDMQTHSPLYEEYYLKAREAGVKFVAYDLHDPPTVAINSDRHQVTVYNRVLEEEVEIPCDLVVVSTPETQSKNAVDLSQLLKVPLGPDQFFSEAHMKLRPAEFVNEGIYVCGAAHFPKDINETIISALAAAAKAVIPVKKKKLRIAPVTAKVEKQKCNSCGLCVAICPYQAVELEPKTGIATVLEVKCKGCGICSSACRSQAIHIHNYTDNQIVTMIQSILSK
ncbi:MAG: CoB--CoM heterodisulfide reductase iron-sulfur subunit A family protein [Candidatus Bathyarchaeota archaeon]|nr:MAG: CoB--CoM heterodisulfide reductase iron-sulfur subunit A family protein [Candidatus Bathyarchaeota archaeon]